MLEFDHFFTFVDPSFNSQVNDIKDFKAGFEKEHPGQGTTAMFSFFEKFYLEWIWLSDLEAAKGSKTRADLRANWQETGWSPFGIGMRGILTESEQKDYYCYNPPYAPDKSLWIHNSSLEVPSMPMIFVQEMSKDEKHEDWWPKKRLEKRPESSSFFYEDAKLEKVSLSGPELLELPIKVNGFEVKSSDSFGADVKINGLDSMNLNLDHFNFA